MKNKKVTQKKTKKLLIGGGILALLAIVGVLTFAGVQGGWFKGIATLDTTETPAAKAARLAREGTLQVVVKECGNGYIETYVIVGGGPFGNNLTVEEGCDDHNKISGDGCSNKCLTETGWTCSGTSNSVCHSNCGDGTQVSGEECDDHNTASGDGCSSACVIEMDLCMNQNESQYTVPVGWVKSATNNVCSVCGNNIIESQAVNSAWIGLSEACDDGHTVAGDGCSATCAQESGWTCTNNVCTQNPPAQTCGNATREGIEQCDDGNTSNNDACTNGCLTAVCGDAFIKAGTEQCDDRNTSNNDACTNNCLNNICGDNKIRTGIELCDDGNTVNGDGCSSLCQIEQAAQNSVCGNGTREIGEQCDDGNNSNTDSCLNSCQLASCGDGRVWSGHEECDDGDTQSGDGCSASCHDEEVTPPTEEFECEWSDVSESDPEYGIWMWECQRGILRGNPPLHGQTLGTLGIEKNVTRAELLTLAFRASEYEGIFNVNFVKKNCFNDGRGEWYEPYACTGKDEGFIVGYPGNIFKGGNTVILAEGLKMFLGALGREILTSNPWYYDMIWDTHLKNGLPYSLRDKNDIIPVATLELTRRKAVNMLYRLQIMAN